MKTSKQKLTEKQKKRIDLSGMFYPLERKYERRWAKLFNSGFKDIAEGFRELAEDKKYNQTEKSKNMILWHDPRDSIVECMFYFIDDPTDLDRVLNLYKTIKKHQPLFAYAIVHQWKDGENCEIGKF